jgi:hypothetical protein
VRCGEVSKERKGWDKRRKQEVTRKERRKGEERYKELRIGE